MDPHRGPSRKTNKIHTRIIAKYVRYTDDAPLTMYTESNYLCTRMEYMIVE